MWTNALLHDQLLSRGLRATCRVVVARIAGSVYERREPISQARFDISASSAVVLPVLGHPRTSDRDSGGYRSVHHLHSQDR